MSRDFQIAGECLVWAKGGQHLQLLGRDPAGAFRLNPSASQLGLTSEPIRVTPVFSHR
jgi:hypothetical protein